TSASPLRHQCRLQCWPAIADCLCKSEAVLNCGPSKGRQCRAAAELRCARTIRAACVRQGLDVCGPAANASDAHAAPFLPAPTQAVRRPTRACRDACEGAVTRCVCRALPNCVSQGGACARGVDQRCEQMVDDACAHNGPQACLPTTTTTTTTPT